MAEEEVKERGEEDEERRKESMPHLRHWHPSPKCRPQWEGTQSKR